MKPTILYNYIKNFKKVKKYHVFMIINNTNNKIINVPKWKTKEQFELKNYKWTIKAMKVKLKKKVNTQMILSEKKNFYRRNG